LEERSLFRHTDGVDDLVNISHGDVYRFAVKLSSALSEGF
jgi:hypothetical protein